MVRGKYKFDRDITIQEKSVVTSDTTLNPTESWSTIATVKASVKFKTGVENVQGDQLVAVRNSEFVIRWRSDVTEEHRIVYLGKNYDIQSIEELGRRQMLAIRAERS